MENQVIEYKSSWRDEYLKIISAFANTEGGKLIIGVDDAGKIKGVENPKRLLEDIPNKIRNKLGIIPYISVEEKEGKHIVIIKVLPSSFPISYNGKYYIRSGSTVQELKDSELIHFLLRKTGRTWDSLICEYDLSFIKESAVKRFIGIAKQRLSNISESDSIERIFNNLELITDNKKITKAAYLLFGNNPQQLFISARIRVGRFKSPTKIIDTVIIEGNLFEQLEETIKVIKKNINVKFEIKGIEREEIWDYPLEAIREAVINAIVHRDYQSSAEIQIKIYDDRIWIWNPGKLPPQLTVDDLKKVHASYPRNPLIANVFYFAGLVEKWGTGTKRILDLCKEKGLPEPEYKEEQGGFSVWFYKDVYTEENLKKMGLNERQIKAVMYVKEKGSITNKEYREICRISERTASRDLSKLVSIGVFEQKGITGRGTKYILRH